MFEFPGYQVNRLTFEDPVNAYYRAVRKSDRSPVLIRTLKSTSPSVYDKANYRNEYEIGMRAGIEGMPRPVQVETGGDRCILVMEEFPGRPPDPRHFFGKFGIEGFLGLAIRTVEVLSLFHQGDFIHCNLNPANIWFDEKSSSLKLPGLVVTNPVRGLPFQPAEPNWLRTLSYLAPEQTGRIDRGAEYRTDFYALGVTFYELLTSELPFRASDPMELAHCLLAREPVPPIERNSEVPEILSSLVLRLMQKNPEDRYQSGFGLLSDLKSCSTRLGSKGTIGSFPLARYDRSARFQIPRKLYGREREIESLIGIWERTGEGRSCLSVVTGRSGIGKTSLVHEFRKRTASGRGYFVFGKFEKGRMNIPYTAIIQAIKDLTRQILSESPERVAAWKSALVTALGNNGRVILEMVPEIQMVIGPQPEVPKLETAENQHRFRLVFRSFVKVFARKRSPLTIFLDDLQWADPSSLRMIEILVKENPSPHLNVVCALWAEEPECGGSVAARLKGMAHTEIPLEWIPLRELDLVHIQALLRDTLGSTPSKSKKLARLIRERTQGNPYFIRVLLHAVYHAGLLTFENSKGVWTWSTEQIADHAIFSKEMVRLVAEPIKDMPVEVQDTLKHAACIGHRFKLALAAMACQRSQSETAKHLLKAWRAGLISPLGESYKLLNVYEPAEIEALAGEKLAVTFQFSHDWVQEAVYSLMTPDESEEIHLRVGKLLLRHNAGSDLPDKVFVIVNQLNRGLSLVSQPGERRQLAELNLVAGERAKRSAAHPLAAHYLQTGLSLLPEDARTHFPALWLELKLNRAEVHYLSGEPEEGKTQFREVLHEAPTLAERLRAYEIWVPILNNLGHLEEAVRIGLEGLGLCGLEIPGDRPAREKAAARRLDEVRSYLFAHGPRQLLSLPRARGAKNQTADKLLMYLTPPAFNTDQELFRLLVLLQVSRTLEFGNSEYSAHGIAALGILLGSIQDYKTGFELGHIALQLNENIPNPSIGYKLHFIGCNLLNLWRRHIADDLDVILRVRNEALEHGDPVYANYAVLLHSLNRWCLDAPLIGLLDECERHIAFARQTKNVFAVETLRMLSLAVLNLRGLTREPESFDSEAFSEERCREKLMDVAYFTGVSILLIIKMQVLYLRGYYRKAYETGLQSKKMLGFNENTLMMVVHYYFFGLTLAALHDLSDTRQQQEFDRELTEIEARFQRWAEHCPANFSHKLALIRAEKERIQNRPFQAMDRYREAARDAKTRGYPMNAALANELAAKFYLTQGYHAFAGIHLGRALDGYRQWGASAKAIQMERDYGYLLRQDNGAAEEARPPREDYSYAIDLATIMKAARTVSGEIRLKKLIRKMMRLVMENAGAQRGVFLLQNPAGLVVEAEWEYSRAELVQGLMAPHEARDDLAKSVIHYVCRTKSDLVIGDVAADHAWSGDEYLRKGKVKSLLCIPLIRQTELVGLLYLENYLATGAFSDNRLEIMRLLAPQIAISLENARHLEEMATLNETLKAEIAERAKAEAALKKAQQIALSNARNAGKAEFANSVLHNIKNVLSSVGVSHAALEQLTETSKVGQLGKTAELLNGQGKDLAAFLTADQRGKLLPTYLQELSRILAEERQAVKQELVVLEHHLSLMRDIIETQQAHAKGALRIEAVDLDLVLEDVLKMQAEPLERHAIQVERRYRLASPIQAHATQLTHVLLNLVKNAIEAMGLEDEKVLTLETGSAGGRGFIKVIDTGHGIHPTHLDRMFTHGFTTKTGGHGFGLNYCAKAMEHMGGELLVHSEGEGRGACFTLSLPKK